MTRAVTVREPEWSADDVALLLASRIAEAAPRGRHGHLISEATDPALAHKWKVPSRLVGQNMVPVATTDYIGKTLAEAQALRKKLYPDEDTSYLLWRVERED